jgi:hypothetical protein
MQNLKLFIDNFSKWSVLQQYVQRIETYADTDTSIVIENCKALIESICKTVLIEANDVNTENMNVNKLIKCTLKHLGVLNQNVKIANSLTTIIQEIGELRNDFGVTAHGRGIAELEKANNLTKATGTFLINVTDNVACYILHVYHHEHPQRNLPRIDYKDNEEFNAYFDELYEKVRFSEYQYLPSEVLFGVDPTAYKTELENFKEKQGQG